MEKVKSEKSENRVRSPSPAPSAPTMADFGHVNDEPTAPPMSLTDEIPNKDYQDLNRDLQAMNLTQDSPPIEISPFKTDFSQINEPQLDLSHLKPYTENQLLALYGLDRNIWEEKVELEREKFLSYQSDELPKSDLHELLLNYHRIRVNLMGTERTLERYREGAEGFTR